MCEEDVSLPESSLLGAGTKIGFLSAPKFHLAILGLRVFRVCSQSLAHIIPCPSVGSFVVRSLLRLLYLVSDHQIKVS